MFPPHGSLGRDDRLRAVFAHSDDGETALIIPIRRHQLPFVNVVNDYPKLDVKSTRLISLQDRVRGMFGGGRGKLTDDSREMRALMAYFHFLARGTQPGQAMESTGLAEIPLPARVAEPKRGKELFPLRCVACHQANGWGLKKPGFDRGAGYQFPPIAGDDVDTDGGYMYLIPVLARFFAH